MKKDKHDVSIKVNGKKLSEEAGRPAPPDQENSKQEPLAIIDWKDKRLFEQEEAASLAEDSKEDAFQKNRPSLPAKLKRKKKSEIMKPSLYFLSITAGAIVIGLLFGMMIIQLFSAEATPTTGSAGEEDPALTASYEDRLTASFIQAGAFTGEQKAAEMHSSLQADGFPGMLTHDGDWYYLFVGVAFEEKEAGDMLKTFQGKDIEVFEKKREITEPMIKDGKKQQREWLLAGKSLLMKTAASDDPKEFMNEYEELLNNSQAWKDSEQKEYADFYKGLENVKNVLEDDGELPITMHRETMEAVIYYEEAVHLFNDA
ncbi:hypothetical protein [Alteribacillus sp. HJP-4]|uniref:hypothetical protein n=1 Tax=Alteribacillus sp. HJP-4 TaxID=2775394 RepID=UPI0035CD2EEB